MRRGYTLIELLVVIGIIGLLMTIGVATYGSAAKRSRDNTRKTDLARLKSILGQHYTDLRDYPTFDKKGSLPVYSASWQLTGSVSGCTHTTTAFLTTKYVEKIPEDPLQKTDLTKQGCSALSQGQKNRYFYITNTATTGPIENPATFGLMAKLENPGQDLLLGQDNPLLSKTIPLFGPWYAGFNNYGTNSPIGAEVNYLISGTVGR